MVNKNYISLLVFLLILTGTLSAQRGDPNLRRIGYHTGNRVGISFYNDGQISGFNTGIDIRGEWPLGSGENYIGDCVPLIGVEFVNVLGDTLHSVCISRGPRKGQGDERHPDFGYFWGWNPLPGFLNPNSESVAMSHLPESWPINGWRDEPTWIDENGNTVWNGYFGRGVQNADQESYFWADDQADDEFNANFLPDSSDPSRKGMGLQMAVRGFQWSSFLAEDVIFWLYDIKNDGAYTYRKTCFGTVVGTLAGGDGDSQDDLGFFDVDEWITYSWDSDGVGNKGQKVGYVGYAFLESPGNPFDGIDNDDDSPNPNAPTFLAEDFDSLTYNSGDVLILINPETYERTSYTVQSGTNTVTSLGIEFTFEAGVTYFREGHIARIENGISIPHPTAYDGIDNDLDGLIDENMSIHYETRIRNGLDGLRHKDFINNLAVNDPLIDEERDNNAGGQITSWQYVGTDVQQVTHFEGDEDADWIARDELGILVDDVGTDGLGPWEDTYPGPDPDGTEANGMPDQGEPNFGKTDPNESDQIGLTSFNFFELGSAPDLSQDEILWSRMFPGRFDVIPPNPQDGDFIYASGYFPLPPDKIERFSVALLFGEDLADIVRNKQIVQQIYDAGYKFPQPPKKPVISITQEDGKVVLYWDGAPSENSIDFISKEKDFEGYKVYRSTDAGFIDARSITNAYGVLSFDLPLAQYDLKDNGIEGFFYPKPELLEQLGGTTFYLGDDTTGIVNRFVDSTAMKGQTYYYAVTSYDRGDSENNIFPAENSIFIFRDNAGRIITDDNTGYITPGARPIGYVPAVIDSLQKSQNFRGTGTAEIEIIDDEAIQDNHTYEISFTDTSVQGYTESWSLRNVTTNTLLVDSSATFFGSTPIKEGFKVQLYNDESIKLDTNKSGFDVTPSAAFQKITVQPWFWAATGRGSEYNGIPIPNDYRIDFSNSNVGNSVADTLYPPNNIIPSQPINFKVTNISTGKEADVVYFINQGTLSTIHNIYLKEQIGDTVYRTWRFNFFYSQPNVPIEQTGKYDMITKKPFSANDVFNFTVQAAEIDNQLVENQKEKIKVVPNPYVVTHQGEARLLSNQTSGRGEREIRFTHIPPGSKISIFTVRGDLIKTLYHNETYVGDVYWNLRTEENLDVAFGVYVYVVELPGAGEKIGKFALIK